MNGLRLTSALLLLPLLLDSLPTNEMGMYFAFLNLLALLPIVDFGFSPSLGRYVSYAIGGTNILEPGGRSATRAGAVPSSELLWQLLFTTQHLFRYVALSALIVVGGVGTWTVNLRVDETSAPLVTWLAWAVALSAAVLEVYWGWWNVFLRGMNYVLEATRIGAVCYAIRLVLACSLLLLGAGLLALPLAGIASSILQQRWSRNRCLLHLPAPPAHLRSRGPSLFGVLWPSSWRIGLHHLAGYLVTHANGIICLKVFDLSTNAAYGLSLQISMMIQGMASVWTQVKWPIVGQYLARGDYTSVRRVLWKRWWLQILTFLALGLTAFLLASPFLRWSGSGKELLSSYLFGFLLCNAFFESQFTFWTTLLFMGNRTPFLWPTMISNVISLGLVLLLIHTFAWGVAALVLAPLLTGCAFGYWYWPSQGAGSLKTSWIRYTLSDPDSP
jgi:O-antigen/teichoic acid export membrane protein